MVDKNVYNISTKRQIPIDSPSFRHLPSDVEAEIGKQVTLSCDVDGYPAPEIRWLHYEEDTNIVSFYFVV